MKGERNKGGRPRIGGRLARVQLTEEQDRAVEALENMTGRSRPEILRDILDAGLASGTIRAGRWTFGPTRPDGTRYAWTDGYFDLSGEEVQAYLDPVRDLPPDMLADGGEPAET